MDEKTNNGLVFSIPKDIQEFMLEKEKKFNISCDKVRHRKGIHHFVKTKSDKYKKEMYMSWIEYSELHHFFVPGSLQDKKMSKMYNEDMLVKVQKYINKLVFDSKFKVEIDKKVQEKIDEYKKIFKDYCDNSEKTRFCDYLNSLTIFDTKLYKEVIKRIDELEEKIKDAKNGIFSIATKYMETIKECSKALKETYNRIQKIKSNSKMNFLQEHKSKTLSSIEKDLRTLSSKSLIASDRVNEMYLALIISIKKAKKNSSTKDEILSSSKKLGPLYTIKEMYEDKKEEIEQVLKESYKSNDLDRLLGQMKQILENLKTAIQEDNDDFYNEFYDFTEQIIQLKKFNKLGDLQENVVKFQNILKEIEDNINKDEKSIRYKMTKRYRIKKSIQKAVEICQTINNICNAIKSVVSTFKLI